MDRSGFANFDFDQQKNEFLFFEHGRLRTNIIVVLALLGFLLWISTWLIDPAWDPQLAHGKGAWIVALLLIMPVAVRVVVLGVSAGWIAEAAYRVALRSFDGKPDFVIGISGIADLNPSGPKAILWDDLIEIRWIMRRDTLSARSRPICLQFAAHRARPSWLWPAVWHAMPAFITERRIEITPHMVGMDDNGIRRLIERYRGRPSITETTI